MMKNSNMSEMPVNVILIIVYITTCCDFSLPWVISFSSFLPRYHDHGRMLLLKSLALFLGTIFFF